VRSVSLDVDRMLALLREVQAEIRAAVVAACERQSSREMSRVASDDAGDTIYAIDKVSEELLIERFGHEAEKLGGVVLLAEGISGGSVTLPKGRPDSELAWRVIVDPIDGTRGIMYQKRSAWVLSAAAPNRGLGTRLSDTVVAVQTEIPLVKQHLSDELWAVRGKGAGGARFNRLTGERTPLAVIPSREPSIEHGYAMLSRFFPGARDELAAIDEEVMLAVLGPPPAGKALCFEEQYASTGGQLYELMIGHDRFNADLRPLMAGVLAARGFPTSLCCHPYDVCTALIASELGVILTDPSGAPFDAPLEIEPDIAWVGYANSEIRGKVEPALRRALEKRGLL
jgi:fructose-1,6-bisphosphatase/inositol monophosphatase family enzyme